MNSDICRNATAQKILGTVKMTATLTTKTAAEMKELPKNEKFRCTVTRNGKRLSFNFFQSIADGAERPHISIVLWCIAMDCLGVMYGESFESWCSAYGYDTDSRKAEKIYKACKANLTKALKLFTEQELLDLANMENEED